MTHWIAGDGLHISFICQLPYQRSFPAWHKDKQTQALPLKEDFRQVPAQVTGQVFQTTWSQRSYTSMLKLSSKEKASSEWTRATNVPENNPTQSVHNSEKSNRQLITNGQQTRSNRQASNASRCKVQAPLKWATSNLQNKSKLVNQAQIIQFKQCESIHLRQCTSLTWNQSSNISINH
jgi:hypothetical protein